MIALKIENLSFGYNGLMLMQGISFDIPKGEFVGIVGPNGSGKTTLAKLILKILSPQQGSIAVLEEELRDLSQSELAKKVAVVPQESDTSFPFTVREIVLMGRAPFLGNKIFEGPQDLEKCNEAMAYTGVRDLQDRIFSQLSAGEKQRVIIARALAQEPKILLLDEPVAFLDLKYKVLIHDLVKKLNKEKGVTVFLITHDINLASYYCDRILLFKKGRIFVDGSPKDVITPYNIKKVYDIDFDLPKEVMANILNTER